MEIQYLPEQIETNSYSELQLYEYFISKAYQQNKVQLSKMFFSFLAQWKELITQNHTTRIETINLSLSKRAIVWWAKAFLWVKITEVCCFFSDKAVEDFLKKYDYKNNPKQHNDPFIITEYDRDSKYC
jgi:hypothetical protein